ncbi:CAP domain-containing protein [Streptomyces somaliensis]|nr:CAP domain-containing protein [Streptomyces somaliensis]
MPRRRAKQRWTYQGIGTVVAGAVAVAAVAVGTAVLGGTGGKDGSLAVRTTAPVPSYDDHPPSASAAPAPTRPGTPGPDPSISAPASPPAAPATSAPARTAPPRTAPAPAPSDRRVEAGARKHPSAAPAAPAAPGAREGGTEPYRARATRTGGTAADHARRVVDLVNAERAGAGCPALRVDDRLQRAAQGHADDMAARDYYAHDTPEGRGPGDRIGAAGYRWSTWAENIHRGPGDPAAAVRGWMESPGHRANILNCAFRDIGVGVTLRSNGPWWVQNFGAAR